MNILIVDDDPDMLRILVAYFKKEGFQIFTTHDGEQALDICMTTR